MTARNSPEPLELTLVRVFAAPRHLVFQCWTDPKHIVHWLAPHGFTIPLAEGELKPGGRWRSTMVKPDGTELKLGGTYKQLVRDELIVMTHAWDTPQDEAGQETLITVRFEDAGPGKTRMTFTQTGFASKEDREGHAGGWGECFERLDSHIKKGAKP